MWLLLLAAQTIALTATASSTHRPLLEDELEPEFAEPVANVTTALGRDAQLRCVVNNLGSFRAAWIKVETKAILTIHNRLISRNYRITLSHSEDRNFVLQVRHVQESDRGGYMCQINTAPMKSQIGYLDVLVPPDIVVDRSSSDVVAREGSNVSLACRAKGYPAPNITWRREDGDPIPLGSRLGKKNLVMSFEGEQLAITRVSRLHMGAYLCIASNGVPPSVSRRIILHVQFPPLIWIPNQLVGAILGQDVSIECHCEAYPTSVTYWSRGTGSGMLVSGAKHELFVKESFYKTQMRLTMKRVQKEDYGVYKCFAKNALGISEGVIRIYEMESAQTMSSAPSLLRSDKGNSISESSSSSYPRQQRFESARESSSIAAGTAKAEVVKGGADMTIRTQPGTTERSSAVSFGSSLEALWATLLLLFFL